MSAGSIQPSPTQRMISACAGSLLTSLLVTPLDVVKTRLQSQTVVATPRCAAPFTFTSNASAYEKLCTCCREVFFAPEQPASSHGSASATGIRANITNALAGKIIRNKAGSSSTSSSSAAASSRLPFSHRFTQPSHHHPHPHHRTRGGVTTASAGCGPSIIQLQQEGTVVGMKTSNIQQERLERLAANCVENNHTRAKGVVTATTSAAQERYFYGTWDGVKKIARYEGASSLWRGLSPTLAMSIPATVIYFVGYDYLKDVLSEKLNPIHKTPSALATTHPLLNGTFVYEYRETLAPLLAGGFARTVAATVISPLELFRTRMQSVHTDTKGNAGLFRGVAQGIVAMVRSEGVLSLWRGLTPTLWRDVPFSAIYWMGYENIKKTITTWDKNKHPKPVLNEFEIAFTSGAISGMIAATLTTPFDVAKTRRQVDMMQPVHTKIMSLMRAIAREEGYRGLWRGLTARVAKIAPSCAIMISSYEIGKKALSEQWWGLGASKGPAGSSSAGSGSGNSGSPEDRLVLMRVATTGSNVATSGL
ncbi:hypothetical protein BGX34_000939 [Mortierella sp. NVP85]|nr:hypothetical protein BGX34_000939 [Mortierella sp. NVP85]